MSAKKWQIVEGVVTAIEHSLAGIVGASVVPNAAVPERNSTKTRQVDVYVTIPSGLRVLKIAVEVRDKRTPLNVTAVEQLDAKLSKLDVDHKCVVSTSGFTRRAEDEAARCGIECRTLSEVVVPDWWLPTVVNVEGRQVQLLHVSLRYGPDTPPEIIDQLSGVSPDDWLVVTPTESVRLVEHVRSQGLIAVDKPELQQLKDQEVFTINIQMDVPSGSVLRYPAGEGPVPPLVIGSYRLHRQIGSVPISAYRMDNIEAFTFSPGVEGKQLTFVSELQSDGTRKVSLAIGDEVPKRTRVPHAGVRAGRGSKTRRRRRK